MALAWSMTRRPFLALLAAMGNVVSIVAAGDPGAGSRWLAAAGPVPALDIPADRAAWEARRAGIRATLRGCLGHLPPRPAVPAVRTLSREDRGTHWEERFQFDNGAGSMVPGVLLLPKNAAGKVPGILYCHWHGGEYGRGKSELFETNHTPAEPGPALVARGHAVLAIDAFCFGERNGEGADGETGATGEASAAKLQLWLGRSLWGMILRDDQMALDYLCSRPEIDASRIGVTGISMGATRSWWLMAMDDRVRAGVAVACLTRYQDLVASNGLRHHGIYYFVPGLLRHFDTEAIVACVAPRALLCLNGDRDSGSPVSGIREIERRVAPAWSVTGRPDGFRSEVFAGVGHQYTPEMWRRMLEWFDAELRRGP
ncbi:MAG: dienelactone hydrolase [Verrucomicrobia bacterium]|nr:MAG: dienelactone hydrolase [Verrucomicrobiota bacterium]